MRLKLLLIAATVFLSVLTIQTTSYADSSVFPPFVSYNRILTDNFDPGTFEVQGELTFDAFFHNLGTGWLVTPASVGLGKYMSYTPALTDNKSDRWSDSYGQSLMVNVAGKPTDWFFFEGGFLFLGDYADKYWIPTNEEHRMSADQTTFPYVNWVNGRIGIQTDLFTLTYNRNYGHQGWVYDGDMFDMLPRQDNPDDFLRYSGHYTPDYWRFKTKGFFGDLDVIYGEEVIQDYKQGIYVKYKNIFGSNINFFYSDHIIPFGNDNERMRNFQLNTDFKFLNTDLQVGALYRPFRLDTAYQYVKNVGMGNGVDGSQYQVENGVTDESDALGGSIQWQINKRLGLDTIKLGYEYRGLVAGDRQKVNASIEKALSKYVNTYLGYYYQKPLLGAMPLIYSGAGAGPISTSGRGPDSPFWVWWRNPVSGFDNRETSAFSFVFTYDPTPSTWFYQYDPNNPTAYNLNPEEDAPFSMAARINLTRYYGSLDRQQYWDANNNVVWEDAYSNGTNAPNRYLGSLYVLTQFIKDDMKILYDFEVGEDLATLYYPYADDANGLPAEPFMTPAIGYFKTSLSIDKKPYLFKIAYAKNYWGPENWQQQFGMTYDELYLAHISRDVGKWFNFGLEYAGGRKVNPTLLDDSLFVNQTPATGISNELGTFNEIRVYAKILFDGVFHFGDRGEEGGLPFAVEYDKVPPDVALKLHPDLIYPDEGQSTTLEPWADDHSGIDRWIIYIKDVNGSTVKTYSGDGPTPDELTWDATNENTGNRVPDGDYFATLTAFDIYGNKNITDPQKVTVASKPKPVAPPPPPPAPPAEPKIENAQVKETERGLVISLGAKVLFDTDKYNLKKGATKTLKEVAVLLKKYPDNDIAIEGHTDWVGTLEHNQILSENRANSVKKFLVNEGVNADRMKTKGYGKLRPIADNRTAKGREQNRRVEIIVLNKAIAVSDTDTIPSSDNSGVSVDVSTTAVGN